MKKREQSKSENLLFKGAKTSLAGMFIGFLGASIVYSQHMPAWVPVGLTGNPYLFFGFLVIVCGLLGFNWGVTQSAQHKSTSEDGRRRFPLNTVMTFMFVGFLMASVLYQKYMPSWVPLVFTEYPVVFFLLFVITGGVVGFFWDMDQASAD